MGDLGDVSKEIKGPGKRLTKARKAIVEILSRAGRPLSVPEISAALNQIGIPANKSTVYRQLAFLEKERIVSGVQLDERGRRFELAALAHHHHLVCVSCREIEDITCQKELAEQEEKILRDMDFKVLKHSLEFFGLCAKCR